MNHQELRPTPTLKRSQVGALVQHPPHPLHPHLHLRSLRANHAAVTTHHRLHCPSPPHAYSSAYQPPCSGVNKNAPMK